MQLTPFIAHRGASAISPENTIESLKLAIELGAKCLEFDVQPTTDGHLVVFHDKTLARSSGINKKVSACRLEELESVQALYQFGAQVPPIFISSFDQYLQVLESSPIAFNCELKCFDEKGGHTANYIDPYLDRLFALHSRCLITSSCRSCLMIAQEKLKHIKSGLITHSINAETFKFVQRLKLAVLSAHKDSITSEVLKVAQNINLPILAFTVNSYEQAQKLISKGVTSIFSDVVFSSKNS